MLRMNDEELENLHNLSTNTGKNMSDIVRESIKMYETKRRDTYERSKKKRKTK